MLLPQTRRLLAILSSDDSEFWRKGFQRFPYIAVIVTRHSVVIYWDRIRQGSREKERGGRIVEGFNYYGGQIAQNMRMKGRILGIEKRISFLGPVGKHKRPGNEAMLESSTLA